MIKPDDLISELGVEGLCQTAEKYYEGKTISDGIMAKPFADFEHTPNSLYKLGLLLEGLRLGRSMTVLDFGAGSCWLSKGLGHMGCRPIALDPSPSALDLGRQLFAHDSVCGNFSYEPGFLVFDGRKIDLPDESVDRIVCFDSFHHVPNREEVIAEFGRILKNPGIVGFSEPGPGHSQSEHSQMEMREYGVLEKGVAPAELFGTAQQHGFTHFYAKPLTNPKAELSLNAYSRLIRNKYFPPLAGLAKLWSFIYPPMLKSPVFFMAKARPLADSRQHTGLRFQLEGLPGKIVVQCGEPNNLPIVVHNVGAARWLASNWVDVGVVRLGAHLLSGDGEVLDWDFRRVDLPADLEPGESAALELDVNLPDSGVYHLELDMVSENICWFAEKGGKTKSFRMEVA